MIPTLIYAYGLVSISENNVFSLIVIIIFTPWGEDVYTVSGRDPCRVGSPLHLSQGPSELRSLSLSHKCFYPAPPRQPSLLLCLWFLPALTIWLPVYTLYAVTFSFRLHCAVRLLEC